MISASMKSNVHLPAAGVMTSALQVAIRQLTLKCLDISKSKEFASGGGKGSPAIAGMLTSRSGRLRASINAAYENDGKTGIVGTNVFYGRVHEYGETVTAQRKSLKHAPHMAKRKDGQKALTGSPYRVVFPERSFLRAALRDLEPFIRPALDDAIKGALS